MLIITLYHYASTLQVSCLSIAISLFVFLYVFFIQAARFNGLLLVKKFVRLFD